VTTQRRTAEDAAAGRLGDVAKALASPRAKRRARAIDAVAAAWGAAAGPALASTTRVSSFRDGTLFVTTSSAPLCHELAAFRRETLLAALNERLLEERATAVKSLVFRIGSA
jgi:predicted nucleic acid-binding Zn ribbon protein